MKDRIPYRRWKLASTISVLTLALTVGPLLESANSQESADDPWAGVEEMLVTGSGSAGLLSDLAQANSVTAFDDEALQNIGAADISDLAAFTPNLEIVTAGATSPTFFIRGIGLNDFSANAAGSVAIYQDDVALNSPALQLGSLFDVGGVNVLRGPQGSGPFRNASAGSIKSYSKKPSGDFGAYLDADYGNYNLVDVQGAVEAPIVQDILSARLAFRMKRHGGTQKNLCSGVPDFEDRTVRIPGKSAVDPRWSYCGEAVQNPSQTSLGVSTVDPFMKKRLNGENNFAGRGVLRFQPDIAADVEMDWVLVLRGTRIDQPSTVGQSHGTSGVTRFPETGADPITGLFAGSDFQGYRDLDVLIRRRHLINTLEPDCNPDCTPAQTRASVFQIADRIVSQEVGRDLDKDPFTGAYSHQGTTRSETFGISLRGDTDIGDELHIRSVMAYDYWKRHIDVDLDFSPNTAFETATNDRGKQIFVDIELSGEIFDDIDSDWIGPVNWKIGGFGLTEKLDVRVDINFGHLSGVTGAPRTRIYTQTVESFAGYTHLSWELSEFFTLDGGFRFNWERRGIDYELFRSGAPLHENEEFTGSEPTGTVRLTYDPTSDITIYMKYTRGWKSGTFNATGSGFRGVEDARAEKIDAFEVGTRQSYFDGLFSIYASFFHYSYQEYQLFTSQSGFQSPPTFVILNASDVELYGSEIEVELKPWEGSTFEAKFAWLEGEFLEFVQTQINVEQVGAIGITIVEEIDNSGNRLLNAPEFTINLSAQQRIEIGRLGSITARWDGAWKDETFFDASEGRGLPNRDGIQFFPRGTIGQKAYWIHNLRLTYTTSDGLFSLAGWIRNLEDETYKTFAADLSTFQQTTLFFIGDPRTFGLSVGLKF